MFAIPSFFGYNTTFVSTPVATAATGVGETSFTANWNAFAGASYYLLDVSTSSSFSSFVGSYQNFVVLTTSQLVSGLTASTTYYYRLRAATGVDADAASFFSRVYTAGGALSYTEVSATETLVADMKTAGVWTAMQAIYPMVGASAAACAQNLVSASFTAVFNGAWTYASTGITGNGTTTYMETGLTPSVSLSSSSAHQCVYSRTNSDAVQADIGAISSGAFMDTVIRLGGQIYCDLQTNNSFNTANTSSLGLFLTYKNSGTSFTLQRNTTQTAFASTAASVTKSIWIGARNDAPSYPSTREYAFASIGDGLTDTQATNFYTAIQAFQTTLSRQV